MSKSISHSPSRPFGFIHLVMPQALYARHAHFTTCFNYKSRVPQSP